MRRPRAWAAWRNSSDLSSNASASPRRKASRDSAQRSSSRRCRGRVTAGSFITPIRAPASAASREVRSRTPSPVLHEIRRSAADWAAPFSARSILFRTRKERSSWPWRSLGRSVSGCPASISQIIRSASEACLMVRRMPSCSTRSAVLRMPAVSVTITGNPSRSNRTSMASRVVPACSETIAASRRARAFKRLDLPTLGGPAITTCIPSRKISPRWRSVK